MACASLAGCNSSDSGPISMGTEISEISLSAHLGGATIYWQADRWKQDLAKTVVRGISIASEKEPTYFAIDEKLLAGDDLSLKCSAEVVEYRDSDDKVGTLKRTLIRGAADGRSATKYTILGDKNLVTSTLVDKEFKSDPYVETSKMVFVDYDWQDGKIHVQTELADGSLVDRETFAVGPLARFKSAGNSENLAIAFSSKTSTCDGETLFEGCSTAVIFGGRAQDLKIGGVPLAVWTDGKMFRVLGAEASGKLWVSDGKSRVDGPVLTPGVHRDFTFTAKGNALILQVSETEVNLLAQGGAAGFVTHAIIANRTAIGSIPIVGGLLRGAVDSKIVVVGDTVHIAWLETDKAGRFSVIQYLSGNDLSSISGYAFDIPPGPPTESPPCDKCGETAEPTHAGQPEAQ